MAYLGRHEILNEADHTGGTDIGSTFTMHDAFTLTADEDFFVNVEIGTTAKPLAGDGDLTLQVWKNGKQVASTTIAVYETYAEVQCIPVLGGETSDDVEVHILSDDTNAADVAVRSRICRK